MSPSDLPTACPVPDFSTTPPAAERSGADIVPPVVRAEDVQEHVEEGRTIGRFMNHLRTLCKDNPSALNQISVKPYRIESNIQRINGVQLFIVSDKKTGKILSYHEEDGRCVLDLEKSLSDPLFMAVENTAGKQIGMTWNKQTNEKGATIYSITITDVPGIPSAYKP